MFLELNEKLLIDSTEQDQIFHHLERKLICYIEYLVFIII